MGVEFLCVRQGCRKNTHCEERSCKWWCHPAQASQATVTQGSGRGDAGQRPWSRRSKWVGKELTDVQAG